MTTARYPGDDGPMVDIASVAVGWERYVALLGEPPPDFRRSPDVLFTAVLEGGAHALETQLVDVRVRQGATLLLVADFEPPHAGLAMAPLAVVWGEPVLRGPAGELSVLDLDLAHAIMGAGEVARHRAPGDGALLLGGRPLDDALVTRTTAVVKVRVPPGHDRLLAECGFDSADLPGPGVRARCIVFDATSAVAAPSGSPPPGP